MQLQKNALNSSEERKQNNSEFNNNSPNPFIFQNFLNQKEANTDTIEKKIKIAKKQNYIKEKNNLNILANLNTSEFQGQSLVNNSLKKIDKENCLPKIDINLDNNSIDNPSNIQENINNNTIYNTNDENFFNISFYNNNKNNNKIINNNYKNKNKLNENNGMKNSSIDEEHNKKRR